MGNARKTRAEFQQEMIAICKELASSTLFAKSAYNDIKRRADDALRGEANASDHSIAPYTAEELDYYRDYLYIVAEIYSPSNWTRKPTPRYLGSNDGAKTIENGFSLPMEMWGIILANLSFAEREKLRSTCKDFEAVIDNILIENPILVSNSNVLIAHPPIFNDPQVRTPTFISLINDIAKLNKHELKKLQETCFDEALALKAIRTKERYGRTMIYNHSTAFLVLGLLMGPSLFLVGPGMAIICVAAAISNPASLLIAAGILSAVGLVMLSIAAGIYIQSRLNSNAEQTKVVGFFDKVKASSVKVEELDENGNVVEEPLIEEPKITIPWYVG